MHRYARAVKKAKFEELVDFRDSFPTLMSAIELIPGLREEVVKLLEAAVREVIADSGPG